MIVPVKIDLTILQGSTYKQQFLFMTGNPAVPVELGGSKFRMDIRKRLNDEIPIISLTTENGRIIIGQNPGEYGLFLSSAETAALNFSVAVYDLEIVYSNLEVARIQYGNVTLSKEITR